MHIRAREVLLIIAIPLIAVTLAYIQWWISGLPQLHPLVSAVEATPIGFRGWLCLTHYVNLFFLVLLVRSGLQILMDHPRLYWNLHCTPGTEWLRLTPIVVGPEHIGTAKEDARHLTPWIGLPGYRHTVGMARHWHFISVLFWIGNGILYIALLATTGEWSRLIPLSWQSVPEAWSVFVHYATGHLPQEPSGFGQYNALQQLSYAAVVFVLAPLALITGPSMSPAFTARFPWYPRIPGNRQVGRSVHFLVMCGFLAFTAMHVSMIALTGLQRNMNHIVIGEDSTGPTGVIIGLVGLVILVGANVAANWAAWRRPRLVQHVAKRIVTPVVCLLFGRASPRAQFDRSDISPYFWVNGKVPTCAEWIKLEADGFRGYRLRVHGSVQQPLEMSLDDLRAMGLDEQVTLHHCIQGWSGIAAWGGVRLERVLALTRPLPSATAVIFHSFSDGVIPDHPESQERYYDSLSLEDAKQEQTLLAYEMNGKPLGRLYGAPLRLRVENQLGFKMVKWIQSIEIVDDVARVRGGEGGFAEDHEYFGESAVI